MADDLVPAGETRPGRGGRLYRSRGGQRTDPNNWELVPQGGEDAALAAARTNVEMWRQQAEYGRQFIDQNRVQNTGGGPTGRYGEQNPASPFPWLNARPKINRDSSPGIERLRGITAAMQKATRVSGEGTSSDVDMALAASMVPNVTTPGSANLARVNATVLEERVRRERLAEMERFLAQNRTLAGFDAHWAPIEASWRHANRKQLVVVPQRGAFGRGPSRTPPPDADGVVDLGVIR